MSNSNFHSITRRAAWTLLAAVLALAAGMIALEAAGCRFFIQPGGGLP